MSAGLLSVFGLDKAMSGRRSCGARHFHSCCAKLSVAGSCGLSSDVPEQFALGLLHGQGGFGVGLSCGTGLQFGGSDTRTKVSFAVRHCLQQLVRRRPSAIDALDLAVAQVDLFGHRAGPVEVDVRVQALAVEPGDRFGVLGVDVAIAQVFSNHRAVLGLHQSVVVGMVRARLGLFDQQLAQQA